MLVALAFGFAVLAAIIIPSVVGVGLIRVLAFVALGVIAVYSGLAPLWGGVVIAFLPFMFSVIVFFYYYWLGRRALSGKMGEPQKWVAEMVANDDERFIQSLEGIDEMDMKEIAVIADTKEELRQRVIERSMEDADTAVER